MPYRSSPLEFSADSIVDTVREPLLVLSADLRVRKANRSFYRTFKVTSEETVGQLIYDLGNQQWDIVLLRKLLEEILPENSAFDDFEVEHVFPGIGRKYMLLNARRISHADNSTESILLAIEDITDRREAEEARRDIENRYFSLVQNIKDHSIFMMDAEGHITAWNAEAERIIGYGESEILGQSFSVIFTPEDIHNGLPEMELRLARENGRAEDERWHLRKNGSRFWALGIVTPMYDSNNTITGFSKILRDMTDRKQAQEELQQSDKRQRFVLDSMPQKVFTAQPNGDVNYFNPQWTEFTGLSFEQIKGWGWKQFIHPDDLAETVCAWQHSIDTGEPFQLEQRFRRADGEYRCHFGRALPMRDEAGRVLMWVGSSTDIFDIKQTEAALLDSEIRYRRLFQTAKDGILILDATSGKVVDANPFMSALLGYSHEEFLSKELWEIGLFTDIQENQSVYKELKEKGYVRYEHLPLASRNGDTIDVEFVSNVYVEDNRQVIQCNIRDITERCRLERQSQEQSKTVADMYRRKDEFLAMLSHELRNPLAPILNAVQMLQHQAVESAVQQKACAIIERQSRQLTHLVNDLMEVSRAITGKIELRREDIDLRGIVERAVETARPLIDQRRHELTLSLPEHPIWLHADSARLEQVVTNLLTNAAKYTPESGQIWISARQEGDRGMLCVRDTGIGIAPDFLPQIFELFAQAERSSDRSQGGLGVGLALVKRLVEMHEGTITVSSELEKGTEFVVSLPIHRPKGPAMTKAPVAIEGSFPAVACLRVLIVDDNLDAAAASEMLVEQLGHQTWLAHTGPTAMTSALEHRPDVILLDIGLPGFDGHEVAKRLRLQPSFRDIVLVAMTGYGQAADRQLSQAAGFDHHLVKPVEFATLQGILASAWERKLNLPSVGVPAERKPRHADYNAANSGG